MSHVRLCAVFPLGRSRPERVPPAGLAGLFSGPAGRVVYLEAARLRYQLVGGSRAGCSIMQSRPDLIRSRLGARARRPGPLSGQPGWSVSPGP